MKEEDWKCMFGTICLSLDCLIVLFCSTGRALFGMGEQVVGSTKLVASILRGGTCVYEKLPRTSFIVLNKLLDALQQHVMRGQLCLCLQNNILFAIKEFCDSVESYSSSSTRSLLFFGPYHQHPIPIHVDFKLLRELDALKLRFYTFPQEILTLLQLKYLALTCNGELPATISKLFKLQILIVHPHMNIKFCGAPSFVPVQIWDMAELEHIEILGKSLVAPPNHAVASLEKLSTLLGVNASIRAIPELVQKLPNITKLGVEIEVTPHDDDNDLLNCLARISILESLETLKCSFMNPALVDKYRYVAPPSSLMLPRGLEKLHLSGMGFPWEYMNAIGSLPFLQVLKLRCFAFRGSKWEADENSFVKLKFLLIEDSDLVQWKPSSMRHCYKLQELEWPSDERVGKIELVDCNPLAFACANKLRPNGDRSTLCPSILPCLLLSTNNPPLT